MTEPLFRVVIEGPPNDAAINRAKDYTVRGKGKFAKAVPYKTKHAKAFEARADAAMWDAAVAQQEGVTAVKATPLYEVRVHAYWPRKRNLEGVKGLAMGDVDAPVKACLDTLQRAGLIDDDVRVVRQVATKHVDKDRPRIEIEVFAA